MKALKRQQKVDVTNPEDVSKMVDDVVNEYGKVDILVNNAGMTINEKQKTSLTKTG